MCTLNWNTTPFHSSLLTPCKVSNVLSNSVLKWFIGNEEIGKNNFNEFFLRSEQMNEKLEGCMATHMLHVQYWTGFDEIW